MRGPRGSPARHDRNADPGRHQVDEQGRVGRLADAVVADTRVREPAGHQHLDAAAAEVRERLVGQVGQADSGAGREPVPRVAEQHQVLAPAREAGAASVTTSATMRCAGGSSARPASLSATRRVGRSNSGAPGSRSSFRIDALSADCTTCTSCAAAVKLPFRARRRDRGGHITVRAREHSSR